MLLPVTGLPWGFNITPIPGRCARMQLVCPNPRRGYQPRCPGGGVDPGSGRPRLKHPESILAAPARTWAGTGQDPPLQAAKPARGGSAAESESDAKAHSAPDKLGLLNRLKLRHLPSAIKIRFLRGVDTEGCRPVWIDLQIIRLCGFPAEVHHNLACRSCLCEGTI